MSSGLELLGCALTFGAFLLYLYLFETLDKPAALR